jgi:hypothetical protein
MALSYFIVLKSRLYSKISNLEKQILNDNQEVESVETVGYEDFLPLSDATMYIYFKDKGSLRLHNITETQYDIIFSACDGYNFFIVGIKPNGEYFSGASFSYRFYEKLFRIPLKNINDFIRAYPTMKEFMDSLVEIELLFSETAWDEIIEMTSNMQPVYIEGMDSEYYFFKRRAY